MKKAFLIFLTVLTTSGFTQDNSYHPKYSTTLESNKGERLLRQCSRSTPKNISEYWVPTKDEIELIEFEFKKVLKLKTSNGQRISDLDKFAFQYLGVTIKGRKFIYINAFHLDNESDFKTMYKDWKTEPIVICDGGDYYWGVLFGLDKLKFKDLAVNVII